jgi:pSer/pThr/pTyr-binding forkhead associated (FHA) protein
VSSLELATGMLTQAPTRPTVEGLTERVDPIACLDERVRRQATLAHPAEPGRYIEVQGSDETLLIPLGKGVTHIGRGLAADLHLDEDSVSRRHAILVHRRDGMRVLDDRSSNGTFVNGRRIVQADLRNGDVLVLGRVVLRYLEV